MEQGPSWEANWFAAGQEIPRVPYVENTLYSTNKYSCVRPVHTLYIGYFIEHSGDDEPHDNLHCVFEQPTGIFIISSHL